MKALDTSADSPTSTGRVDWFAFLSSINGGLRINPDLPLGIGADSELCFSFEDAKHAVSFSRDGARLFVTPVVGAVTIAGEQILERVPVEANTTLWLGQTPMFIATSPILETMPPILVRERPQSERPQPKQPEVKPDDRVATNVFQLPTRVKPNSGIGEILVPAGISEVVQPDIESTDWAVATKTPQTLKIRIWRLALLVCLSGAVLFPWLKQYIPTPTLKTDTRGAAEIAVPEIPPETPPETALEKVRAATAPVAEVLAEPAVTRPKTEAVKKTNAASSAGKNTLRIIVPEQVETLPVPSAPPAQVALPAPVAQPSPAEPPVRTPVVSSRPKVEKLEPAAPISADSVGIPQKTAYTAIEQVDTEHLLVAAQWAMRNGDAPGALILLDAIVTKVPDHAQALVLRDQLRRIMAEVELE